MATCYVYEHLEFRVDIPGLVAFALLFLERREIVEKRSNPEVIVESRATWNHGDHGYSSTCHIDLGNHYAIITGNFRPIQLMPPGIGKGPGSQAVPELRVLGLIRVRK